MPVALESKSNTSMLLRVQDDVLHAKPVCLLTFPPETPAAFGLLQSDASGMLSWLTQYVNALVPPPNLLYYVKGLCASDGSISFVSTSPLELRPYASKVVFLLVFKIRSYSSSSVAAVYGQGYVTYDPTQPLDQLWTSSDVEMYGDDADKVSITVRLQRTVANSVDVSFSGSGTPGNTVEMDVAVDKPNGIPLS